MEVELRSLRHVLALARHGHYGRAAAALNLSQSALSRSIAALERDLGVRLFDRSRRGIRPTMYGALLVQRGEAVLGSAAALEREFARLQGLEHSELRVGAGLYPADISVAAALGRLVAQHPGVRISLMSHTWRAVVEAVVSGQVDLAVVELSPLLRSPGLEFEPLPPHGGAFVCRAGHPLAHYRDARLDDILALPLVGPTLPPRVGASLVKASRHPLVDDVGDYVPPVHVDGVQAAVGVLLGSDCVAALPLPLVATRIEAGDLVALDYQAPWLRTNYGFAWSRERPLSPPAEAFMAEVRAVELEVAARSGSNAPP